MVPKKYGCCARGSWNKLDADTQLLIKREAAAAEEKGWMLSRVGNIEDKKALAAAGMVVGKVNADLEKHFQKVGKKMAKEWKKKSWQNRC